MIRLCRAVETPGRHAEQDHGEERDLRRSTRQYVVDVRRVRAAQRHRSKSNWTQICSRRSIAPCSSHIVMVSITALYLWLTLPLTCERT